MHHGSISCTVIYAYLDKKKKYCITQLFYYKTATCNWNIMKIITDNVNYKDKKLNVHMYYNNDY